MLNNNQTIPYFYIIKNDKTNMQYAGAKWGNGANPDNFLTESGYKTSSTIIHDAIKEYGLESFKIVSIVTDFNGLTAYDYETEFLNKNNCAGSPDWYNCHNNTMGVSDVPTGSDEFKKIMLLKYGVENPLQNDEIKQRFINTNLERYGTEYATQNTEIMDKYRTTNLTRYGYEYVMQNEEVKAKSRITCLEKYGTEHYSQTDEWAVKQRQTNLIKFGAEHPTQSEEVMQQIRDTNIMRYGCEYAFQREDVKNKIKQTARETYGVEHVSQTKEFQDTCRATCMAKYGVEHYTQSEKFKSQILTCPHCGLQSNNPGSMGRWHNDNCRNKKTIDDA